MKKYLLILICAFTLTLGVNAQSDYNLSFTTEGVDSDGNTDGTNETDKFNVIINLSFDLAGELGGGNIRFDFDPAILSNPTLLSEELTSNGSYLSVSANSPATGVGSLNIVHFPGNDGMDIGTELVPVAVIQFDVAPANQDGTSTTDLTFRTDGTVPSTTLNTEAGGSLSAGVIMNAEGASLPIELSSFEVAKRGTDAANLTWTTETEVNGSHFEIEKSYTGASFTYVGKVQAVGETTETQNYNMLDSDLELIPNQATTIYYRLKMVDNDGSFEYSDVKTIEFSAREVEVQIHPNPTVDFVTMTSQAKITGITIVDIDGKIIRDNVQYNSKLDFSGLNSGMYKVLVSTEDGEFVKSVIKID